MKLSTGKIAFPIEFDNGDKQNIYFNPNDPDLAVRLQDFQTRVDERVKELADVELTNEGMPKDENMIDTYLRMRDIMCSELDVAFNGDISAVVFKHCAPFAIVNGEYFVVQFIEAIMPEIEKHIQKANADTEKKMQKHIGKYAK